MRGKCLLIVFLISLSGRPGCATSPLERFSFSQLHMGVQARLTLYAPDAERAADAARAAFARLAELDQIASDWRPTSELRQLCRQAGGLPVAVSADLSRLLSRSLQVSRLTGGAFDITVGPAVTLWRTAREARRFPAPADLARARAATGYGKLLFDESAGLVQLAVRGMLLDLGGVAKGDAGDQVLAVLRDRGFGAAMLELGGDIVVGAAPPGTVGWRIAVPSLPVEPRALTLADCALSTSGDTVQFVILDGVRYSHVVDPRTGRGVTHRTMATVIAPTGLEADPLATACTVLGVEAGTRLLSSLAGVRGWVYPAPE